jgi:hypothetical protein
MKKAIVACMCAFLIMSAQEARADRRSYVWTYEYQTMPKGMFEVEYYLTEEQKYLDKAKPNIWKQQIEIEYGVTDHFDLSMYQMFKQSNTVKSSSFEYDGFKIRGRYRILEKNVLPVDVLLYLEYIRDDDWNKPNVLEEKIVIAKDIGRLNLAYNQIFEQELTSKGRWEYGYAFGASYAVMPSLRIGAESKGNYNDEKYYIGPTVSWSHGRVWASAGVVLGLTDKSDDMQARLIVGVLF